MLAMRADNRGEGGTMVLIALARTPDPQGIGGSSRSQSANR
jgi:K+ transporter